MGSVCSGRRRDGCPDKETVIFLMTSLILFGRHLVRPGLGPAVFLPTTDGPLCLIPSGGGIALQCHNVVSFTGEQR